MYGMTSQVRWAAQNSLGVADTSSMVYLPAISFDVNPVIPRVPRKNRKFQRRRTRGPSYIEGTISFAAHPDCLALALQSGLGLYSSLSSGDGNFNHTFKIPDYDNYEYVAGHPLTIELCEDGTNSFYYRDCTINQIAINIEAGNFVGVDISIIGRGFEGAAKQASSDDNLSGLFIWDQTSVYIDGAANKHFSSLVLTINNNLEQWSTLTNTSYIQRIARSDVVNAQLTGEMIHTDSAQWASFVNQDQVNFGFNIVSTSGDTFNVDVPNLIFSNYNANPQDQGLIIGSFTADADYLPSSDASLQANMQSTYALNHAPFVLDDPYAGKLDQTYNVLKEK